MELMNLHFRIHQLYISAKKANKKESMKLYEEKHSLTVLEINRRGLQHKSPLRMSIEKVKQMYSISIKESLLFEGSECWKTYKN